MKERTNMEMDDALYNCMYRYFILKCPLPRRLGWTFCALSSSVSSGVNMTSLAISPNVQQGRHTLFHLTVHLINSTSKPRRSRFVRLFMTS